MPDWWPSFSRLWRRSGEHTAFRTREDGVEKHEVHVAGVCLRRASGGWEVLVARRQPSRRLFPDMWECGGGQVRHGEGFTVALRRQFFEEFRLDVDPRYPIETYEITVAGDARIIPGVRMLCEARDGIVQLNPREFSEYRWIRLPVSESLNWIGGIKEALDTVAADLQVSGVELPLRLVSAPGHGEEVQAAAATCLRRFRDRDFDGAITSICGAVDKLTEEVYGARHFDSPRADSFQQRVSTAFAELEATYMTPLYLTDAATSKQLWHNHRGAVNQAAYVLGALRRNFSDAHGAQRADAVLAQRAIDCGIFIVGSLGSLWRARG